VLDRLGVSRNVFRESLRLLERYGIVRVRRGNNGGVHGIRPDPSYVVYNTAKFLGEQPAEWRSEGAAMLRDLVLWAVDAAMLPSEENLAGCAIPEQFGQGLEELVRWLSERAGNPILEAAMQSLVRLLLPGSPVALGSADHGEGLRNALEAGDNSLARRNAIVMLQQHFVEVR